MKCLQPSKIYIKNGNVFRNTSTDYSVSKETGKVVRVETHATARATRRLYIELGWFQSACWRQIEKHLFSYELGTQHCLPTCKTSLFEWVVGTPCAQRTKGLCKNIYKGFDGPDNLYTLHPEARKPACFRKTRRLTAFVTRFSKSSNQKWEFRAFLLELRFSRRQWTTMEDDSIVIIF